MANPSASFDGLTVTDRLRLMVGAIDRATSYVDGRDADSLGIDRKSLDALYWTLCVLGEASRRIPEELRHHYTDQPWRIMADTRNRLIHDYARIDPRIVVGIVEAGFPPLRAALLRMLDAAGRLS